MYNLENNLYPDDYIKEVKEFLDKYEKEEQKNINVTADGKEYGEIWTLIENENIINKIRFSICGTEDNKFKIDYVAKSDDDTIIIHLLAGKNGQGEWNKYFLDAISIINRLTCNDNSCILWLNADENINVGKMFKKAWLIKWTNDCSDDISSLYIGAKL